MSRVKLVANYVTASQPRVWVPSDRENSGHLQLVNIFDEAGGAALVTIADVNQSNGVIHVVNDVLLPK